MGRHVGTPTPATSASTRSASGAVARPTCSDSRAGGDEADADGLAVGQCIATRLLEGVGEGVPEIEHGAPRLLERIVLDDGDLDLDGLGDENLKLSEGIPLLVTETVPLATFELGEQVGPGEQRRA